MIFKCKAILLICLCITFPNASMAITLEDLKITSSNLIIQKDKSTATFSGQVIVTFDDIKLSTSKIIVFYNDTNGHRDIKKIIIPLKLLAIRNCGEEIITADTATFDNSTQELTLTGNVHLQKEGHILVTNKLVYLSSL